MTKLIEIPAPAACYRLEVYDEDLAEIANGDLVRMLALLHLIREFELKLLEFKDADLIHGPVHASIGQEAVAAAVGVALRGSDMVASTHRAHGHFLTKALTYYAPAGHDVLSTGFTPAMQQAVDKTLAEIMGLEAGWCGGRGGSMHLCDPVSGNLGSNAIVGGGIPIATGAAWAQRFLDSDAVVVSFFGDGAINQGCFHEVANMAALWGVPILYVVENNLYAVGTSTGESSYVDDLALRSLGYGFDSMIVDGMDPVSVYIAVQGAVAEMRREPFPFLIEATTYRYRHHGGGLVGSAFGYRSKDEEQAWLDKDPLTAFPEKLIRLGFIDQAQDQRLREMAKVSVGHAADLVTQESDGQRFIPAAHWPPAESATRDIRCEEDVFFDVSFKELEDFAELRPTTYVEAIASVTLRNMDRDQRVVVLGEEVANLRGGAYAATRGIKQVYPERLVNTPISETGFTGMAGGLALAGLRPIVEVMYPDFALMASDQLFNQIGKLRHMYGGQVSFPIVIRTRVAIGYGYGGQHSLDPGAFFAQFSGWRVMAPSNAFDYVGLFNTAMYFNDPVLMVEHGLLYQEAGQVPIENLDYAVAYGKAKVVRPGSDVTVLTYLTGVAKCVQIADELEAEGVSAEVIDLRTLDYTGMDYAAIGQSVQKTGSALVVEQGPRSLTLGARISDEIQERFFDYLDCPIARVAGLDVPPPVSRQLEDAVVPSMELIKAAILRAGRHLY
jgi:2-oxoisovalerate dehydrogenase E1 component